MTEQSEKLRPPHTKDYYKIIGESNPNRPLRAAGSVLASFFAELKTGRLKRAPVPQATRDYAGPAIFVGVHRAKRDIPDSIKMINRAGFNSARPFTKKEWLGSDPKEWLFHGLGSIAVDRGSKFGLLGAVKASIRLLERGQNVLIYEEGTRIEENTRTVAEILGTSVMLALKMRNVVDAPVPVIVLATAGASIDDEKHCYGFGAPVIGTMSEPLYFAPHDGQSYKAALEEGVPVLHQKMQDQLDLAYLIREQHARAA